MKKPQRAFACTQCGAQHAKWSGQCSACEAWNSLTEEVVADAASSPRFQHYAGKAQEVTSLRDVSVENTPRTSSGMQELDRVLGGGLVAGSVILIGGDPGIGKSTLLLQALSLLSAKQAVLYVSGEESLQQISLRASRLELSAGDIQLFAETQVETILEKTKQLKPRLLVIDSIQTMHTQLLQSAPGSVGQVRDSAAQFVRFAKQTNTTLFLVGHVTKDGALAGPRVLEHMVDTVLYFEGERSGRLRLLRSIKNRFGAVNELGVFAMSGEGLREVTNPSAIFLSNTREKLPGSIIMATWEGTRPLLVEVQALVDQSNSGNPRRVTVGLEQNRLAMLLAVLNRHAGVACFDQDVFVNAVGGVRIVETAADLPLLIAVMSSLRQWCLPPDLLAFGEVGLAGEIRPVQNGQERLKEAAKQGFKFAIIPKANCPKKAPAGMQVMGIQRLSEVMDLLRERVVEPKN
ncbi:MAG: DNA repair protein RadA [marine bacterium B5-7]|nr:MAG: DNA repair protein RadA [marine bacterium B5-7]